MDRRQRRACIEPGMGQWHLAQRKRQSGFVIESSNAAGLAVHCGKRGGPLRSGTLIRSPSLSVSRYRGGAPGCPHLCSAKCGLLKGGAAAGSLPLYYVSIHMSPPRPPTPHSSPEPPRFSERPPRCAIRAPPSQGYRNMFSLQMSRIALVLALTLALALALTPTPTPTPTLTLMELASIA